MPATPRQKQRPYTMMGVQRGLRIIQQKNYTKYAGLLLVLPCRFVDSLTILIPGRNTHICKRSFCRTPSSRSSSWQSSRGRCRTAAPMDLRGS